MYPYLSLAKVLRYEPLAKALGVSEVARGPRGFPRAYREAGGRAANLSPYWQKRREGFISRHLAQVVYRGEPLWDEDGHPTRRHLALIMGAFSPHRGVWPISGPGPPFRHWEPAVGLHDERAV